MTGSTSYKLLLIFCLVLVITGVLLVANFYLGRSQPSSTKSIPQVFADINPGPKTTTILAPNGKMTLVVKEERVKDGVIDTFSTQDEKAPSATQIYSETLPKGTLISVPFNTFSPDNKYIFLKKTAPNGVTYFVLKTDGTVFAKDEKTIDFLSLFKEKYPDDHSVTDVTGWGGINLIVVNTDKPDGTISHSFWYDVASNSFIQLSTRFN